MFGRFKDLTNQQKKYYEPVFHHQFKTGQKFTIKLRVTNQSGMYDEDFREIDIDPSQISKKRRTGNLQDNKEFYEILEKREILCKITHGVIDGPHLAFDTKEFNRWKLGKLSGENEEKINNAIQYNKSICEIVNKCLNNYKKKRVLLFANSVKHSQELALILAVKYRLKAKSIDGGTNPGLRRKIIREYREGNISVLCNFGVLTTGFDVPKIDVVIICRDVGSNALYTQMIGRGQRGNLVGGTDELWLITSFFPKSKTEQFDLKLGWEALSENWNKFPPDIKEDLKVKDFKVFFSETETFEKKIVDKNPQIIMNDPLRFKCLTCYEEGEGFENMTEFFGTEGNREIIQNALNDGSYPKHCLDCRKLRKIAKYTKCGFCELFLQHHNYDPIFIIIANYANNSQIKKESPDFKDLQNELYENFKKNVDKSYFDINNPIIKNMEKLRLLKIKGNLKIEFKKILELKTLKKLIEISYQTQKRKKNGEEIIDKHKNAEILDTKSDNLRNFYSKLKKDYGHIPTKRQFHIAIREKEEWWKEFNQKFNANYDSLLDLYMEIIKDDEELKDSLYDEYFEKCMFVRDKITREQLDKHGKYRIIDYEEIFGSFDKFEQKLALNLKRVLDNYDQKKKETDKEFEEIGKDLKTLKEKLGEWPHFEYIRIHSKIQIYRYIIQLKISHLQYLKNYNSENIGSFLRLVTEFFKLKEILLITPTNKQFTGLTSPVVTGDLGAAFNFNYNKFLETINVSLPSEKINSEHVEIMQEKTIKKLKEIAEKDGKEKVISIIESAQNKSDELSISIKVWFEDVNSLKRQFQTNNHHQA